MVTKGVLFVTDTFSGQIFRIEPSNFLNFCGKPEITTVISDPALGPNGIFPLSDDRMLFVGSNFEGKDLGIYEIGADNKVSPLLAEVGTLDGVAVIDDTVFFTDWKTKSLRSWDKKTGITTLAKGFEGPADFCIVQQKNGFLFVIPDLVKSELRFIEIVKY
jgi:hypothetical protein